MHIPWRDHADRIGSGLPTVAGALFFFANVLGATTAGARDAGQIRINLTVPERVLAEVQAPLPQTGDRVICVSGGKLTEFSIATSVGDDFARRLTLWPGDLDHAQSPCAGLTFSVDTAHDKAITVVISPE